MSNLDTNLAKQLNSVDATLTHLKKDRIEVSIGKLGGRTFTIQEKGGSPISFKMKDLVTHVQELIKNNEKISNDNKKELVQLLDAIHTAGQEKLAEVKWFVRFLTKIRSIIGSGGTTADKLIRKLKDETFKPQGAAPERKGPKEKEKPGPTPAQSWVSSSKARPSGTPEKILGRSRSPEETLSRLLADLAREEDKEKQTEIHQQMGKPVEKKEFTEEEKKWLEPTLKKRDEEKAARKKEKELKAESEKSALEEMERKEKGKTSTPQEWEKEFEQPKTKIKIPDQKEILGAFKKSPSFLKNQKAIKEIFYDPDEFVKLLAEQYNKTRDLADENKEQQFENNLKNRLGEVKTRIGNSKLTIPNLVSSQFLTDLVSSQPLGERYTFAKGEPKTSLFSLRKQEISTVRYNPEDLMKFE